MGGTKVKVSGRWIEDVQSLQRGAYVEITGGLKATTSQPKKDAAGTATTPAAQGGFTATIHAHKVSRLEDSCEHAELWEEELHFLNTNVYPLLASANCTMGS
ncbi:hypothetical protein DUNSADRAFT_10818 [Dunaliella salina]|uniref:Encoded protein n=1 Tax=Dunaliella salina TaxID=3046 RepID=A0ABQ7H9W5_DUNSA|nr:hypothetical protein DUNSADRAFT_10818 [Dunaliella salina]|eukprot:KAF5843643.1 hypothetical protein DUNSADRAFT_10818 [Dunaliella salina]